MKIAIATEGNEVCQHFGKCENFTIVELDGATIVDKKVVNTKENLHSSLPGYLASFDVKTVLAGGMGGGASTNLSNLGIIAITGVQGTVDSAINDFANGLLKPGAANCNDHHQSGGHTCSCGHGH